MKEKYPFIFCKTRIRCTITCIRQKVDSAVIFISVSISNDGYLIQSIICVAKIMYLNPFHFLHYLLVHSEKSSTVALRRFSKSRSIPTSIFSVHPEQVHLFNQLVFLCVNLTAFHSESDRESMTCFVFLHSDRHILH